MAISLDYVSPGTIGSYADLVALVADYMNRDDLTQIPAFISIIEAELNRRLRTVNQETRTIWVIGAESYDLPSGFRKMRKIHIEGQPDRPLDEISPTGASVRFNGDAGIPRAYWTEGRTMMLAPPPAADTTFRVVYLTRIVPLTSQTPLNWVLEEHPDIYVWGALREAAAFIRDPDGISFAGDRFSTAVEQLRLSTANDRWGGGPLIPVSVGQVRGGRR